MHAVECPGEGVLSTNRHVSLNDHESGEFWSGLNQVTAFYISLPISIIISNHVDSDGT